MSLGDVLDDIPEEYRDRFKDLLLEPPCTPEALRAEVKSYIDTVNAVAKIAPVADLDVALHLAKHCVQLCDWAVSARRDDQQLVRCAVHYFVREDEDEEVTGVLGFDDDVQIFNAVCRGLGRQDLVIPFQRKTTHRRT